MANLHSQNYQIKLKQGLAADINATETTGLAVQGEPHYTTDTKELYIFDGSTNVLANTGNFVLKTGDTMTGALMVDGSADAIQLKVQGHSTQTANLTEWQNSSSGILAQIDAGGGAVFNETGLSTADFRVESDTEANMLFLDSNADTNGALYLGGTTNGIKINKGGELTLLGTATRFTDLRVEPVVRTTGARAPSFVAYKTNCFLYDFPDEAVAANEKELFFTVQLPHDWKEGSTIYPHVHWVNRTTGTAGHVAKWSVDYTKSTIGGTFGATTNITGTTIVGGGDITVADGHLITSLPEITCAGDKISTILICRLYRNSSDVADTYTGTAGLLYVDFHYEIDTIGGSREEFTK